MLHVSVYGRQCNDLCLGVCLCVAKRIWQVQSHDSNKIAHKFLLCMLHSVLRTHRTGMACKPEAVVGASAFCRHCRPCCASAGGLLERGLLRLSRLLSSFPWRPRESDRQTTLQKQKCCRSPNHLCLTSGCGSRREAQACLCIGVSTLWRKGCQLVLHATLRPTSV